MHKSLLLSTVVSLSFIFIGCGGGGNSVDTTPELNQPTQNEPISKTTVNQAPVATFGSFTIQKDGRYDGELKATDADGDMLKYVIVRQPQHGTVVLHDNGCFTYTPDDGYQGSDTFSYRASDDVSSCAVKTVTVDVCAPTIQKPAAPSNLKAKALSTTSLELTWSDNSDNEEGFAIYKDGKLICTTKANKTTATIHCGLEAGKTYNFEVRAKNQAGNSTPASVEGTTKDVTTPPAAPTELKAKAVEKTSVRLEWKDNADNESAYEVYQDGVKVKTVSAGCACTVIKGLEKCTNYNFVVKAVNKIGSTDSNTITVTTQCDVVKPNQAPIATPQTITMDEDTTKAITLTGTDPDGDALTYTVTTPPTHGTFANGVYTPNANYHGSDSFSFTASDGSLTSAPATVSITITDVPEPNRAPTATPQTITMNEDTTKAITLTGTDPDGDALTYTVTTPPTHGTFANGVYTPTANYHGSDSFSFTASDGSLTSAPATVSITINSVNDAPVVDAGADKTITQGDSYSPTPASSDSDGTIASTVWTEGATTLTFPKTDFTVGEHILTVTATDNEGATATDTLTLTVEAKPVTCTPLPKTGQTIVYSNFDDGHYQKGASVDPRFVRDDVTQTVKDNVTGLVWQDDEEVQTTIRTWQGAIDHCEALELGTFTNWRLPTIEELVYITDKFRIGPAIDPVFQNIVSEYYWSSTTNASNTSRAWVVDFGHGNDKYYRYKTRGNYVRCVRDGQ